MRTALLRLPSGFGEIAIFWSKLSQVVFPEIQWNAELCLDDPRGSEFFVSCLPGVKSLGFGTHHTSDVLRNGISPSARIEYCLDKPIYPTVDQYLIRGRHIKDWLPETPINYHYPLIIQERGSVVASLLATPPYVLVYPSALTRGKMGGVWNDVWDAKQWADLCARLDMSLTIPWYLIGSGRDIDMLNRLVELGVIPKARVLTPNFFTTLALIQKATYMVGFPAGPAVMAGVMNVPHCMLFREVAQKWMRGSFTDPEMISSGTAYLPFFTESPGKVASEVLDRISNFTRQPRPDQKIPHHHTGVKETVRNDPHPVIQGKLGAFNLDQVLGFLGRHTQEFKVIDKCRYIYAITSCIRPQNYLDLGSTSPEIPVSALSGSMDNGAPVRFVRLVNAVNDRIESAVRQICCRVSPASDVKSFNFPMLEKLEFADTRPWYDMVHIDAEALMFPFKDTLHLAFSLLGVTGMLVISGSDDPVTREAIQLFSKEKNTPVYETTLASGWSILYK